MDKAKQSHHVKIALQGKEEAKEDILALPSLSQSQFVTVGNASALAWGHRLGHLDGVHDKGDNPCGFAWLPALLGPLGERRREEQHRFENKR